ncbi:hypothetical protein Tco_0160239, partial [Tanacetum coccineum]
HQDEFENKEITETFPLKTLGSVALHDANTPWFADFTNYHAGNFIVKGMSSQQKNKFFKDGTEGHYGANYTVETDIQEKEQKESQKQTNPSTGRKGPSQVKSKSKVIHMKKIQLEGLKLPRLKLYHKRLKRQGSKLPTG